MTYILILYRKFTLSTSPSPQDIISTFFISLLDNTLASVHCPRSLHPQPLAMSFPKFGWDRLLPAHCEVLEWLQPYSPTTASNGAIPPTVGDCLELRNQLTTDAYPLTLPLNSRQATLVLRVLSSFISLSYLLLVGEKTWPFKNSAV